VLLHRFLNDAGVAPPGLEERFREALAQAAAGHHAAVERALDWVIAMCVILRSSVLSRALRLCFALPHCF
jgi:hypothetical protein